MERKKNLLGNGGSFFELYGLMHPIADIGPHVLSLSFTQNLMSGIVIGENGQLDISNLVFTNDSRESFTVMDDRIVSPDNEQDG